MVISVHAFQLTHSNAQKISPLQVFSFQSFCWDSPNSIRYLYDACIWRKSPRSLPTLEATHRWLCVANTCLSYRYRPILEPARLLEPHEPSWHWCPTVPPCSHRPDSSNSSYQTKQLWAFSLLGCLGPGKCLYSWKGRTWKRKKGI